MKFNKKLLVATIGVSTALILAGCGVQHHTHKSTNVSSPSSTKVVKSHKAKTHKHAVKKNDKVSHDNNNQSSNTSDSNNNESQSSSSASNTSHNTSLSTNNNPSNSTPITSRNAKSKSTNDSSEQGLPTVNLGDGVIGNEDRGAGQEYITFSIHGHQYTVHGNDVQPGASALPKAQSIVHSILG